MRMALALATAFIPAAVYAAADPASTWAVCGDDAQCVAIEGVCGPTAVNVRFDKQAQVYYKDLAAKAQCAREQRFWVPSLADARAKCWQQRCQIVGK